MAMIWISHSDPYNCLHSGRHTSCTYAHHHTSHSQQTRMRPEAHLYKSQSRQLLPQQVQASTLPETLSPESTSNLVRPPINLHLSTIYILIDPDHAVVHIVVLLLALPKHLEDEVAADGRVVGVAKVLVHALLEGFDALAQFLGVVGVDELLEDGARV
jgi:hypothetical protein